MSQKDATKRKEVIVPNQTACLPEQKNRNHNINAIDSHQQANKKYQTARKCYQKQKSSCQDNPMSHHMLTSVT